MDQKDRIADEKNAGDNTQQVKKPYHKPTFRYEHVFETMALACGKVNRRGACKFVNPKS